MQLIGKRDPTKAVFDFIGCALFAVLGCWLISKTETGLKGDIAGGLCIAFFGSIGIGIVLGAFDKRPVLVIDDAGVLDRRSTDRVIPWAEIKAVCSITTVGQPFFYLDIGVPVGRFTRNTLRKLNLLANQGFGRGVPINVHGLNVTADQVAAELKRRLPEHFS